VAPALHGSRDLGALDPVLRQALFKTLFGLLAQKEDDLAVFERRRLLNDSTAATTMSASCL
jgi:hypothetical protein